MTALMPERATPTEMDLMDARIGEVERVVLDALHRGQTTIPTAALVWALEQHLVEEDDG